MSNSSASGWWTAASRTPQALSAFDPEQAKRSLGVFSMLTEPSGSRATDSATTTSVSTTRTAKPCATKQHLVLITADTRWRGDRWTQAGDPEPLRELSGGRRRVPERRRAGAQPHGGRRADGVGTSLTAEPFEPNRLELAWRIYTTQRNVCMDRRMFADQRPSSQGLDEGVNRGLTQRRKKTAPSLANTTAWIYGVTS